VNLTPKNGFLAASFVSRAILAAGLYRLFSTEGLVLKKWVKDSYLG
jgi:hypothetical protein